MIAETKSQTVFLNQQDLTPEFIVKLKNCSELNLKNCKVRYLYDNLKWQHAIHTILSSLTSLTINQCPYESSFLNALSLFPSASQIVSLSVDDCQLDDEQIAIIKPQYFVRLRNLSLEGNLISNKGVCLTIIKNQKLRSLKLNKNQRINVDGFNIILLELPSLDQLNLCFPHQKKFRLDDKIILTQRIMLLLMINFPQINELCLDKISITTQQMDFICMNFPSVDGFLLSTDLLIRDKCRISNQGVLPFRKTKNVLYIQLKQNLISDISGLTKCSQLRQLSLDKNRLHVVRPLRWLRETLLALSLNDNHIDTQGAFTLAHNLTRLRELFLKNNYIDESGFREIVKWMKLLKILVISGAGLPKFIQIKLSLRLPKAVILFQRW